MRGWFTRSGSEGLNEKSRMGTLAAVRFRHTVGVLAESGRATGQRRAHCRTDAVGGCDPCNPPSGAGAHSGTNAVAGVGALSVVLLFLFLDDRAAGDSGKNARLLPGDDDRLAGVGVCREPARS